MDINQLNSQHGIPGHLNFIEGEGGFPFILINNRYANALISVYAAQVLSFQPINEPEDLLFLSPTSHYDEGKAIRGGIPICWPWFGLDPIDLNRPDHGFARNDLWTVVATEITPDHKTNIKLRFQNSLQSKDYWQHAFTLELDISIGDTLTLELVTHNTSAQLFSITQALHSYFKVGDINQVLVLGLENTHYLDILENGDQKYQLGAVTITTEVDRIYTNVNNTLIIDDRSFNRQIVITSTHNKNAVVWNPWSDSATTMPDLANDDYQHFICVEAGNVATDIIEIQPNKEFRLITSFKIIRD